MLALQFAGRDAPSTVISFAQKTLKDGQVISKLHVIELGSAPGELQPVAGPLAVPSWCAGTVEEHNQQRRFSRWKEGSQG
jgi:hypothetical protein